MKELRWFCSAVLGSIMLLGCGGGAGESSGLDTTAQGADIAPTGPVMKSGGTSVTALMGPAGGRLDLANGARVEIPAGAIQDAKEIVFKDAPRTTVFKDEDVQGNRPVGPIILVTPELYAPEGSYFVISIPFSSLPEGYDESSLLLAYETPSSQQRNYAEDTTVTIWNYEQAAISGGRAVAKLGSLPGMRFQFILSRND
ncbi:MAG: hypothetical protein JXA30_18745 [Deltaproteobacteria bacterium]|nr:hypothetical protein [Deltaproteobacteria bacterium]